MARNVLKRVDSARAQAENRSGMSVLISPVQEALRINTARIRRAELGLIHTVQCGLKESGFKAMWVS